METSRRRPTETVSATIHRDLRYLPEDRTEYLDAYLPDGPGPHPVVIVIHGGGWAKGDKAEHRQTEIAKALVQQDYAVFSINYKLTEFAGEILQSPVVRSCWPDCLHDCRTAIAWTRAQSSRWNLDPNRIALFGLSAGAHLALLTAVTTGHPEWDHMQGSQPVSCLIYFYGVHELGQIGPRWRFGESLPDPELALTRASSSRYLSPATPPVFVAHGEEDKTVPLQHSLDLIAKMKALNIPHHARILPDAPHGFGLCSAFADLRPDVFAFLREYLG